MQHRRYTGTVYGAVPYGIEKDPKGGWRAWWGTPTAPSVHECATRIGAIYAARRGARKAIERNERAKMWREINGYGDV